LVLEDFYSPDEISEMLKAGRSLCSQAPKDERKVFSTTESEGSQVGVAQARRVIDIINIINIFTLFLESRAILHRVG